ncbi:hypothetical protein B0H67DRAFT_582069 [Lasiosphaeris hirsuta]|uniref:C2H2-type domain-containing protein n=1 Tax=Lasiosphaeris hirsuta TaxID=260670 RepID=A0AA40AHJ1_9PEZI|nr:hypothetical protein B0H67DRAFT_582069 [Lasiosphaeris hirsuta]
MLRVPQLRAVHPCAPELPPSPPPEANISYLLPQLQAEISAVPPSPPLNTDLNLGDWEGQFSDIWSNIPGVGLQPPAQLPSSDPTTQWSVDEQELLVGHPPAASSPCRALEDMKLARPARSRKHACDYLGCSYACALPKDLKKHKIKHLGPSTPGHQSYQCPNPGCDKQFPRKDNGLRHAKHYCRYRPFPPSSSCPP